MDLQDYQNDPFAPRPKASQEVAAAKRARPTHDTEPIQPIALPRSTRKQLAIGASALLIILAMIGMAAYQLARIPEGKPLQLEPTTAPASVPAAVLETPTAAPVPSTTPAMETYIVDAFAAPDGVVLGPVDLAGEAVTAVGRAGVVWVQLQRPSGDRVWFRRRDLPPNLSVPDGLPDLAPRPAPAPPAPQTDRGPAPIVEQPALVEQPIVNPQPQAEAGEKQAPDRADHHATAVARLQLPPPARDGSAPEKGSK